MGYAQKILPHYTYEDWQNWEGKWELHEGSPIAMSPAPLPKHQRIAASLQAEFVFALKQCRKCFAYDPMDYKISDDTIFMPDVLVVCGEIQKPYLDFPPSLVVEVLSKPTALRDRNTKYSIYEQQGIKYYLIVDIDRETIEIYELINGQYALRANDGVEQDFEFEEDCKVRVSFADVW